jgi:hypothetical protein
MSRQFLSFSNNLHGYEYIKWRSTIPFELQRQLNNKKVGKMNMSKEKMLDFYKKNPLNL